MANHGDDMVTMMNRGDMVSMVNHGDMMILARYGDHGDMMICDHGDHSESW